MQLNLTPEQIGHIVASPAVNGEYSNKVKELDRRLQRNGLSYREWDLLNDRQRSVYSEDMFLEPECGDNIDTYVKSAIKSCGCPETLENLHHHSPVLMKEISGHHEATSNAPADVGTNESLTQHIDDIWSQLESEDC